MAAPPLYPMLAGWGWRTLGLPTAISADIATFLEMLSTQDVQLLKQLGITCATNPQIWMNN